MYNFIVWSYNFDDWTVSLSKCATTFLTLQIGCGQGLCCIFALHNPIFMKIIFKSNIATCSYLTWFFCICFCYVWLTCSSMDGCATVSCRKQTTTAGTKISTALLLKRLAAMKTCKCWESIRLCANAYS